MQKLQARLRVASAALFLAVIAAGCETTKGFGRDVENAGENIEDVAEDAHDALGD